VLLKRSQPTHGVGFDQKRVLLTPYFLAMPATSGLGNQELVVELVEIAERLPEVLVTGDPQVQVPAHVHAGQVPRPRAR
jgi:hypothetical protein